MFLTLPTSRVVPSPRRFFPFPGYRYSSIPTNVWRILSWMDQAWLISRTSAASGSGAPSRYAAFGDGNIFTHPLGDTCVCLEGPMVLLKQEGRGGEGSFSRVLFLFYTRYLVYTGYACIITRYYIPFLQYS